MKYCSSLVFLLSVGLESLENCCYLGFFGSSTATKGRESARPQSPVLESGGLWACTFFVFFTLSYLITTVQSSGDDLSHLNYEIAFSLFVREHAMHEVLLRKQLFRLSEYPSVLGYGKISR